MINGGCNQNIMGTAAEHISSLLDAGVHPRQLARYVGMSEDELKKIRSRDREATPKEFSAIERLARNLTLDFGPHLKRCARAIDLINKLLALGLTEKQIADSVGVGAPYISQILHGHRLPGGELMRKIEQLLEQRELDVVHLAIATSDLPEDIDLVGTAKTPGVPLNGKETMAILKTMRLGTLEALVSGSASRIALPEGIPAAAMRVGDSTFIVNIDVAQCGGASEALEAHELEAIGEWCLARARELRTAQQPSQETRRPPKRWG